MVLFVGRVLQHLKVIQVHRKDKIEALKVHVGHWPRANILERIPAPLGSGPGSPVGLLTRVIRVGSGRIRMDDVIKARITHKLPENAFRGRRPTDVSHAHKQNADSCRWLSHWLNLNLPS